MSVPVNPGPPRNFILPSTSSMTNSVALIRIFLGIKLFVHGLMKWSWLFSHDTRFGSLLNYWMAKRIPLDWYSNMILSRVMMHVNVFTWLVVFGELILGLMLIVGFCTRLASIMAIFLLLNYTFASWGLGMAFQGMNEALLVMAFICLITGAGRVLGLDFDMAHRNNRGFLW